MSPRRCVLGLSLLLAACGHDADRPPVAPTTDAVPDPAPAATSAPVASAEPAATAAAPPDAPPRKLNVLLLTIDSMRSDMPWAGYDRDIAPVLTAFEKKAVSYTRAYAISSYTAMSLGGLLAGRYPSQLSRSGFFFERYPDTVTFFPKLLKDAGVKTFTTHAHFYFNKAGFKPSFDTYEILPDFKQTNTTDESITSPQHVEAAKRMLSDKANTSGPFFAWFHFLDPHDEYMPHPGIGPYGKKARDKYDAEITFVDQHVGKLLEFVAAQPWGKNTAIIVSSDHGEGFGEHKFYKHGFELYEMLVHVPLMIQAPGITPRRIDAPRSAIDLAPTILELEGVPAGDAKFDGTSLVGEMYGKPAPERDVLVDLPRTTDNDRRRALIHGKYKLMVLGDDFGFELYDVVADPGETNNLRKSDPTTFEDMKARYKELVKGIKDVCPANTEHLRGKASGRRC